MLKTKLLIHEKTENIPDNKATVVEEIERETRFRGAVFLKKMGFSFESLLSFLRNPEGLPKRSIIMITRKILEDVIGANYFEIKKENLTVKFVYTSIIEKLFGGFR